MRGRILSLVLMGAVAFSNLVYAGSIFRNLGDYKNRLNFQKYYQKTPPSRIKVAILDKGFWGYQDEVGKSLPRDVQYIAGPIAAPEDLKLEHGLRMAQIFTALLSDDQKVQQWIPELYLYNVYGFSNFKFAIEDLIAKKVDLVLYSEVWEYGGNFDGHGFINAEVSKATEAGILWINAAGNFQKTTYNAPVKTISEDWVQLPNENQSLKILCRVKDTNQKCQLKAVLAWNDFKDDVNIGTDKDLDFVLSDDLLNIIQTSALRQSQDPNESRTGFSKYSREIITAEVSYGTYFLRVKNRSQNFGALDRLRISLDGNYIEMPSHSVDETLLIPADNPSVISVGASDSERSSQSIKLKKPEIFAPSSIVLANGEEFRGSSNSAAIVAAGVGVLKALHRDLGKAALLRQLTESGANEWEQTGFSLQQLGFWFTGPNCFVAYVPTPQQIAPYPLDEIYRYGGVFVHTSIGVKIMLPVDPLQLLPNAVRSFPNDVVAVTPQGMAIYSRFGPKPYESVEVFQRPIEAGICSGSSGSETLRKSFRLP